MLLASQGSPFIKGENWNSWCLSHQKPERRNGNWIQAAFYSEPETWEDGGNVPKPAVLSPSTAIASVSLCKVESYLCGVGVSFALEIRNVGESALIVPISPLIIIFLCVAVLLCPRATEPAQRHHLGYVSRLKANSN